MMPATTTAVMGAAVPAAITAMTVRTSGIVMMVVVTTAVVMMWVRAWLA